MREVGRGRQSNPSLVVILSMICALTGGLAFSRPPEKSVPGEQWLTQGSLLVADGKFPEAIAFFGQVKQQNARDARPYFFSGIALTELGRLSAAASELSEAVRLSPGKPEYQLFHADVLARLNHKDLAVNALTVFLQIQAVAQLNTEWQLRLSGLYYRLERFEDALRVLQFISKQVPSDPRPDVIFGRVYAAKGKFDMAQRHLEASIRKKPLRNPDAYFELGKIFYRRN